MPSFRNIVNFANAAISQLPLLSLSPEHALSDVRQPYGNAPSCPVDSPVSCHNSTAAPDSCCFIHPGGQLLSTQFWDSSPPIGPADSWTLHGLWPDLCDGSYPTYCTAAPTYYNITSILYEAGQIDLIETMLKYWLPNYGAPERFWQHEWNKHGTCVNTLAPTCYGGSYKVGDEVVDFFTRAVEVFQGLDTYKALESHGIVPSYTATYTSAEIQEALTNVTGSEVVLGCWGAKLNQAWYSFNVQGSIQTGKFVPTAPVGKSGRGSCPEKGIKYLPKREKY